MRIFLLITLSFVLGIGAAFAQDDAPFPSVQQTQLIAFVGIISSQIEKPIQDQYSNYNFKVSKLYEINFDIEKVLSKNSIKRSFKF